MAYTETTTTGYGTRVGRSFKGIGGGFLMFIAGTALLWWNEGRAVKTDKMLNEAEKVTVEMENPNKLNHELEGELVCASAVATTTDSLTDTEYGLGATAIALSRQVEYYQWVESAHSESHDKFGGKQETVTTYTYQPQWVSSPVESSTFKDPEYQGRNYTLAQAKSQALWAENVTFGAYQLPESMIHSIRSHEPFILDLDRNRLVAWDKATRAVYESRHGGSTAAPAAASAEAVPDSVKTTVPDSIPQENKVDLQYVHQNGNVLYFGRSPQSPEIGDVRITFEKTVPAMVTIIGKVKGNTFTKFKAKNGKTFSTLVMGKKDAGEIYDDEHTANNIMLWVLRLLGILLVINGLKGIFAFLETLLKVVPFLSNIVGFGVGVVCTVIGIAWSLVIIALAWLFYRPLLGIGLLALAGFLVWVFAFKGKDKLKSLAQRNNGGQPAPAPAAAAAPEHYEAPAQAAPQAPAPPTPPAPPAGGNTNEPPFPPRTMKKTLLTLTLTLCLAALTAAQAQVIPSGSKWFDGGVLYTAAPRAGGTYIYFNGISANEGGFAFALERIKGKAGEYRLIPSSADDVAPFRSEFGSRVQYVRREGMNFLAVYDPKGALTWTLTLTPDDIDNCIGSEAWAEEQSVNEMLSSFLMNTTYLSRFSRGELQNMLNGLEASAAKRTVIEATNAALIRSELAIPDDERYVANEDPTEGAPTGETFYVANEVDFIAALGSDRTVYVNDGLVLNLTPLLNNTEFFTDITGRAVTAGAEALATTGISAVATETVTDGMQLSLVNLRNLTIVGGKSATIVVEPRYAFVLNFIGCENIRIENLTIGHTEEGFCDGGVVGLKHCKNVDISRCDLYGCGTYGIEAFDTDGLLVQNSIIRDCSYGIVQLHSTRNAHFVRTDFLRNREFDLIYADAGCQRVSFDECRFCNNEGMLFNLDTEVMMRACEVHHEGDFGTTGRIKVQGSPESTTWDHGDEITSWSDENIGPELL